VHIAVTSINTPNKTHNIVPAECSFLVDIRVNELYTFDEVISIIKEKYQQSDSTKVYQIEFFLL